MISGDESIKCGWCDKDSTADEWQKATLDACYTREQRRAFRKLDNEKYFKKDSKMFYMCPKCKIWQQCCNLTLLRYINGNQKKIGGKPVIRVVENKV